MMYEKKIIPNTDDRYCATTDGRIWSCARKRFLTQFINPKGYAFVSIICKDGKQRDRLVHRLIAITFIPNPENKATVNHINEVKTDNRVENLEWATQLENNLHGTRLERIKAIGHSGVCFYC